MCHNQKMLVHKINQIILKWGFVESLWTSNILAVVDSSLNGFIYPILDHLKKIFQC